MDRDASFWEFGRRTERPMIFVTPAFHVQNFKKSIHYILEIREPSIL